MFKTQNRWKPGALLLAAPLAFTAVSVQASEKEKDPKTGDWNQSIDAANFVGILKSVGRVRSADGDVYIFKKDGTFEYRRGKKSAKGMIYLNDYGRFTVKAKVDTDGRPGGPHNDLILKIATAKRQSSGKVVKRTDSRSLDLQQMSNYQYGNDPDGPNGGKGPVVLYYLIGGKRFR